MPIIAQVAAGIITAIGIAAILNTIAQKYQKNAGKPATLLSMLDKMYPVLYSTEYKEETITGGLLTLFVLKTEGNKIRCCLIEESDFKEKPGENWEEKIVGKTIEIKNGKIIRQYPE